MPENAFAIYQTQEGYAAVTSATRQAILEALEARGPLELPDLVEVTDRSKSTLSSVHMRDLLGRGLVEERPHPSDGRKKRFALVARRIGSSELPVDQLRDAVKDYVERSPLAVRLPLTVVIASMASLRSEPPATVLRSQGFELGAHLADLLDQDEPRGRLMALTTLLDREGVA
ncbi:MAG: winged helix-turn-helix domain-containing protein, partial [Candidatus Thermoplasmatota archaeon]|nr:winged helix-turn-helix domain-containing protein [Candidatus Thermoplasmatota archaeon]